MSADIEGALGKYRPKTGDVLLAEKLLVDQSDPNNLIVDQLRVALGSFNEGKFSSRVTPLNEGVVDAGRVYEYEVPAEDLYHLRFGGPNGYDITKIIDQSEPTPDGVECNWRAWANAQRRGIVV